MLGLTLRCTVVLVSQSKKWGREDERRVVFLVADATKIGISFGGMDYLVRCRLKLAVPMAFYQ